MLADIQLRRSGSGLISAMLLWPRCRPTLGEDHLGINLV
jgi:hypothetical protein